MPPSPTSRYCSRSAETRPLQIRHYCNSDKGETVTLPEFTTFVPETYELGVIQLDGSFLDRAETKNPRRR